MSGRLLRVFAISVPPSRHVAWLGCTVSESGRRSLWRDPPGLTASAGAADWLDGRSRPAVSIVRQRLYFPATLTSQVEHRPGHEHPRPVVALGRAERLGRRSGLSRRNSLASTPERSPIGSLAWPMASLCFQSHPP